jgi:radical SAM superfamily enzyme YgiQ (UPF0313 family)
VQLVQTHRVNVPLEVPGAILLVSCYELGRPPLGVALAAAFLEDAGFQPAVHDLAAGRLPDERIQAAQLVLISVPMHTALRLGASVAGRVRSTRREAAIVFFGHYALLNAVELKAGGLADAVLGGECEAALVELARAVGRGEAPERAAPKGPVLDKLHFVPPSRGQLAPLSRYAALAVGERRILAGAVEASRGCKHLCRHCPIPPVYGGRFFVVPLSRVLEDVAALAAQGAGHVSFSDPDFLNGPTHALRVAQALHDRYPALSFDFTAKIEHLLDHRRLLPAFRAAGCLFVVSAVESLSDRVLAVLDKGHDRAGVFATHRALKEAGIALRPSLLPFTPWAGLGDFLDLLEVYGGDEIDAIDPVQLSIRLLVPPGSLLESHPEMTPHLLPGEARGYARAWRHPDPRMDALAEAVGSLVAAAARSAELPRRTVARIAELAARHAASGSERAGAADRARAIALRAAHLAREVEVDARRAPRVPRMTEPWFC